MQRRHSLSELAEDCALATIAVLITVLSIVLLYHAFDAFIDLDQRPARIVVIRTPDLPTVLVQQLISDPCVECPAAQPVR